MGWEKEGDVSSLPPPPQAADTSAEPQVEAPPAEAAPAAEEAKPAEAVAAEATPEVTKPE